METIFFTIVDPIHGTQRRISFSSLGNNTTLVDFPQNAIYVAPQQMAELGHLLIALAGKGTTPIDTESIDELLDGFKLERKLRNIP